MTKLTLMLSLLMGASVQAQLPEPCVSGTMKFDNGVAVYCKQEQWYVWEYGGSSAMMIDSKNCHPNNLPVGTTKAIGGAIYVSNIVREDHLGLRTGIYSGTTYPEMKPLSITYSHERGNFVYEGANINNLHGGRGEFTRRPMIRYMGRTEVSYGRIKVTSTQEINGTTEHIIPINATVSVLNNHLSAWEKYGLVWGEGLRIYANDYLRIKKLLSEWDVKRNGTEVKVVAFGRWVTNEDSLHDIDLPADGGDLHEVTLQAIEKIRSGRGCNLSGGYGPSGVANYAVVKRNNSSVGFGDGSSSSPTYVKDLIVLD